MHRLLLWRSKLCWTLKTMTPFIFSRKVDYRRREIMGEPKKRQFLFQSLSVLNHNFNSITFHGQFIISEHKLPFTSHFKSLFLGLEHFIQSIIINLLRKF